MVCQNVAPQKCLFMTWLLLYEKLATYSYLQRVGVQVDPICCLCEKAEESLDHLFFECEFAGRVWKGVAEWRGVDRQARRWEVKKLVILSKCTNNNGGQRL